MTRILVKVLTPPLCAALLVLCAALGASRAPRTVRLGCTADANVSSHPSEVDLNYGHSARLRLKGIEMLALARFDMGPIHGWKVEKASLFLHAAGEHRLKTVGLSTV